MGKWLALLIVGLLVAVFAIGSQGQGDTSAPSGPDHRITQNTWGCQQRETLAHITELRAQGDTKPTTAALSAGIDAQDCITLDVGDKVYLVDAAVLSGLSKVRKAGQTAAYWVALEAVE